jgi:hypothetical protein
MAWNRGFDPEYQSLKNDNDAPQREVRMRTLKFVSFLLLGLLMMAPVTARAQHEVLLALAISDPKGQFDDNTDTGFGFHGQYLHALGVTRYVSIGLSGAFLSYGSTTDNNITFLQGMLQFKAPTKVVQPYIYGSGGIGWFFTTTTLEDTRFNDRILSDTNQDDVTFVWGGGGGLQVKVWQAPGGGDGGDEAVFPAGPGDREPVRVYLDLGARYLKGNEVEYLREGSLITDEGEFDIDRRLAVSEIEMMQYQIGVSIEF